MAIKPQSKQQAASSKQQAASSKQQAASSKQQAASKNVGLLGFVKCKFKATLGYHPALVVRAVAKNSDIYYFFRPRYKNGVISQSVIFNLFGILRYTKSIKSNCNSHIIKAGFTLIELSIVLVIIGLLIGGIRVGQDLIYAAKVRAQLKQIEEIETKLNTFKTKYNCTAGDCPNATAFLGVTDQFGNTVYDGDGDGIVKAIYSGGNAYGAGICLSPAITGEVSELFHQLGLAGLGDYVKGNYNNVGAIGSAYPYIEFGNGTGVIVSCLSGNFSGGPQLAPLFLRTGNIIVLGVSGSSLGDSGRIGYGIGIFGVSNYLGFGNTPGTTLLPIGIPADASRRIDEKIDDGKPSSGKFGIIAGQTGCDNVNATKTNQPLLSDYPTPTVSCNVTAGKKID